MEGRGQVRLRRHRLRLQDQVEVKPSAALPETLALLRLPREDRQGSKLLTSSAWYSFHPNLNQFCTWNCDTGNEVLDVGGAVTFA